MLATDSAGLNVYFTRSIHLTEPHSHHGLLRRPFRAAVAMSRLDPGSVRRTGTVNLSDTSFDTPFRRLPDRFALASDVGPMENPNLVI